MTDLADRIAAKRREIEAAGLCQWGYRDPNHIDEGATMEQQEYKQYRKKSLTLARPYVVGEDVSHVSIGDADRAKGCPKAGDMLAQKIGDPSDNWLIEGQTWIDTYDPTPVPVEAETAAT